MGDIADHLIANFMDYPEDQWGESERPLLKTCRYCGTKGLHWGMIDGRWRLHDKDGNAHYCMGGVVVVVGGRFPVGLEKWKEKRKKV